MFSIEHRPIEFQNVKGQELVKNVLKSVLKSPENSPKAFIFEGEYGTGKTTMARIFSNELSKQGTCDFKEFDSAVVGDIESMRSIVNKLSYNPVSGYRVVVFDEIHLVSKQAQSVLLKLLERPHKRSFFVFCTTEVEKLLDTIRSRAIELRFEKITESDLTELIKETAEKENLEVDEKIVERILRKADGHARNCLQQLELYSMLGEAGYLSSVTILDNEFKRLFKNIILKRLSDDTLNEILSHPVSDIKRDFNKFIENISHRVYIERDRNLAILSKVILEYIEINNRLKTSTDWYLFFNRCIELVHGR